MGKGVLLGWWPAAGAKDDVSGQPHLGLVLESRSSHWVSSGTGAASEPVCTLAGCQDPFSGSSPGPWACVVDEFHSKAA